MSSSIARITYVGLDVHQDSISVALLRPDGVQADEDQITNTPEAVRKLVRRWKDPTAVRVCYEAGPTGYGLQRTLAALGVDCSVIAPALIPAAPDNGSRPIGATPESSPGRSGPASSPASASRRQRKKRSATSCGPARI